jgi:hypothetical protein
VVNQTVKRPDVVSFIGEPLQKGLEATGPVRVKLWVSSNRVETDFTARLIDVYPDGYAMNLAEGQIRTSYRNGNGKLEPMQPGKVYELTMDLGSTSNLFETGHRIRLDVSSSSFPRLEPNPNTGESGMWDKRVAATNSLYNGTEHPSYVELTILPE